MEEKCHHNSVCRPPALQVSGRETQLLGSLMNVLRELAHAFEETRRLRPCFYLLTGAVGFVGGGVGIAVMYFAGMLLGGALGIDANAPLRNQAGGAARLRDR